LLAARGKPYTVRIVMKVQPQQRQVVLAVRLTPAAVLI